jgi:hypothetical protein
MSSTSLSMKKPLAIFCVGLAVRVAIILINPIIFGGDTIIRLTDRYTLLKSYQLPMLQVLIAGVSRISMDPVLVRYMVAVIGAVAGVAFYFLVRDLFGETYALPAALLFATNPFVTAVSTVPFQEILMLAALFLAFHFFYRERWLWSSLLLGIACLTRYEAWIACPVLAVAYILRKDRTVLGWIKAAVLFGWMPAIWVVAHRGFAPTGHFVVERSISIWRLQRYVYLGWITVKFTQITVVLLALVGAWRLFNKRAPLDWKLLVQIAFAGLFCVSLLFSAHGVMPDPERYVASREAHIPIYFVVLLAALGLAQWPRWTKAIVAVSVVLGIAGAFWCAWLETSKPEIQLAWKLARYFDTAVHDGEKVLILSRPVDDLRLYLDKARETGGEEGLRQARLELQNADLSGTDYNRLLIYSRLPRNRLLAPPTTGGDWVAVWSDYPDASRKLAGAKPVEVLRSGGMSVTILRAENR